MSTLRADTIQSTGGGAATLTKQSAAKAWVNFNGQGTVAIRDSFGLSSVTDDGAGKYDAVLSSNMSDTNYAAIATGAHSTGDSFGNSTVQMRREALTTSTFGFRGITFNTNCDGSASDSLFNYGTALGDLA